MKFSMMTYSMARQGKYDVEDIIRTAAELKMDGIDWVTTYGRPAEELRQRSADAGLPVVAYTFFLSALCRGESGWEEEAERELANALALNAPLVMIPTPVIAGLADRKEIRRVWTDALAKMAEMAGDAGLILSVENFPGMLSPFVTAADFLEAKRQIPSLQLTFDNGNAATGEDPVASLRACAGDIVHVHLKDWQRRDTPCAGFRQMLDGRYYAPALIGEGVVDSKATLRELAAVGYRGCINIEYESDQYPADKGIARALSLLRS